MKRIFICLFLLMAFLKIEAQISFYNPEVKKNDSVDVHKLLKVYDENDYINLEPDLHYNLEGEKIYIYKNIELFSVSTYGNIQKSDYTDQYFTIGKYYITEEEQKLLLDSLKHLIDKEEALSYMEKVLQTLKDSLQIVSKKKKLRIYHDDILQRFRAVRDNYESVKEQSEKNRITLENMSYNVSQSAVSQSRFNENPSRDKFGQLIIQLFDESGKSYFCENWKLKGHSIMQSTWENHISKFKGRKLAFIQHSTFQVYNPETNESQNYYDPFYGKPSENDTFTSGIDNVCFMYDNSLVDDFCKYRLDALKSVEYRYICEDVLFNKDQGLLVKIKDDKGQTFFIKDYKCELHDWSFGANNKAKDEEYVGYYLYPFVHEDFVNKYIELIEPYALKEIKNINARNAAIAKNTAAKKAKLVSKYGESAASNIMKGNYEIGMTEAMCREIGLGALVYKSATTRIYKRKNLFSDSEKYLVFVNGRLSSISNNF